MKEYAIRLSTKSPLIEIANALGPKVDKETRGNAIAELNALFAKYGDTILGSVSLSSDAQFPTLREAGDVTSIMFGVSDRERIDVRWTQLFSIQDRRAATTRPFKIIDTYNSVGFKAYLQGERIEIGHVYGDQVWFEPEIVAGGVGWNMFWMDTAESYTRAKVLSEMMIRWARRMSQTGYGVLCASGLNTTAYDLTGTGEAEKDINTINKAILDLETGMFTATDPEGKQLDEDLATATFYLLYNSGVAGYESRLARALEARFDMPNDNQSVGRVLRAVVPIGSRDIPTGGWHIFVAGRKSIFDNFRDYQLFEVDDPRIAGVAHDSIGQGEYLFIRGDSNQGRTALTA